MSDDPREAKRKMEKVFLCPEIWFDCLPFLSRAKVGFEFALVSDRFDGLADMRPSTLGDLWIEREQGDTIIIKNHYTEKEEYLPFPEEPLPNNVIGFKRIIIDYIDHKVIDFLHRIRRLFQPKNNGDDGIELRLFIHFDQVRSWAVFRDFIWPLINPSVITKLVFWNDTFDIVRRRISPTFLLDWANVRMLDIACYVSFGNGENGQLLRQWLYTPREDGKPKLLNICMVSDAVEQFKTEFLSAQNAVSFIIVIHCYDPVPFELDNWRTGERLTFRKVSIGDTDFWLLERGPIGGRDAEKWAKWEEEVIALKRKDHNVLSIDFYDNDIGPLDEIAGPSGQQLQQQK